MNALEIVWKVLQRCHSVLIVHVDGHITHQRKKWPCSWNYANSSKTGRLVILETKAVDRVGLFNLIARMSVICDRRGN